MGTGKIRLVTKTFWRQIHIRTLNNSFNKIHERAPRVLYNFKVSTFIKIFQNDKSVIVQQHNLQVRATELHKTNVDVAHN